MAGGFRMKNETNQPDSNVVNDAAYEYAFDKVPRHKRKKLLSLMVVLAGYPIALSNFVIGGTVGVGLSFWNAVITLLVGNALLISIVILTGILAYRTGLSTAFLSKRAFGKSGSYIFSFLLGLSAITWISLNGDIFSRLIDSTFTWWPIPVSLTAVIVIFMWLISAVNGYKGLQLISFLGVPAALILSAYGVFKIGESADGFEGVFNYIPAAPITFSTATAAVVGGWIFGATITPDVCRYAKSKSHVVIAGIFAFIVGCFSFQMAGALIAISTGIGEFTDAMVAMGMGLVAFFTAVFALWTTQDNNIYGASLALQNVIKDTKYYGKIKHKHIAIMIATMAAIFAAAGIYNHIMPIIQFLALLIPPVPGIIIVEEFFIKRPKPNLLVNKSAFVAWAIGGIASFIALQTNFFVPPIIGIVTAGLTYLILEKFMKQNSLALPEEEKKAK